MVCKVVGHLNSCLIQLQHLNMKHCKKNKKKTKLFVSTYKRAALFIYLLNLTYYWINISLVTLAHITNKLDCLWQYIQSTHHFKSKDVKSEELVFKRYEVFSKHKFQVWLTWANKTLSYRETNSTDFFLQYLDNTENHSEVLTHHGKLAR